MTTRYPGGLINKSSANTSLSGASGMWSLPTATQKAKLDQWPVGGVTNPIVNSLRFRASASGYLSRTAGTPTSQKTWTYSAWVKRGLLASANYLVLWSSEASGADYTSLVYYADAFYWATNGTVLTSTAVYRDTSAWYHIVLAYDTTQATSSNRIKLYVNGQQVTSFSTIVFVFSSSHIFS